MAEDQDHPTYNRLLLDAARSDNVDQLKVVFAEPTKFDINFQDGVGNTALHYAASEGSLDVLVELLEYEGCDVDFINYLEGATPLHLAVKIESPELRALIVDSLIDAGADTRIKDKAGYLARDYVKEDDTETLNAFLRHQAQDNILGDDIASDYDEDEQEDEYEDSESDDE
ncbi:ankyrin repeat-containing domain protein [Russula dissimulans]|nr:ankyrin repeat-containing domain protein [Russula dissimulans]